MDNDNNLFEEGKTPWDMLVDVHLLLEEVVASHNRLAHDHEQVVKALKKAELKIEELRRLYIAKR